MKKLIPIIFIGLLGGCSLLPNPRLRIVREGMDAGTKSIREEHLEWAQKLHDGTPINKLSDADLAVRQAAEKSYEDFVTQSRQLDK